MTRQQYFDYNDGQLSYNLPNLMTFSHHFQHCISALQHEYISKQKLQLTRKHINIPVFHDLSVAAHIQERIFRLQLMFLL